MHRLTPAVDLGTDPGCVRLRLACSWPILIGRETLKLLRTGKVLDPQQRIKVSRPQIRRLMLRSVFLYPCSGAWERQASAAPG